MANPRQNTAQIALWTLEAALIAVIGFFLVKAAIAFITPSSVWEPVALSGAGATAPAQQVVNISPGFDPFHRQATVEIVELAPDIGESAPETSLDLTLVGRRDSDDDPTAQIRTANGQDKTYRIDDEILSGVTLHSVHKDYVVISQNGRLERLPLREDSASTLTRAEPDSAPVRNSGAADLSGADISSVTTLLRSVSLVPVRRDGQTIGLEIRPKNSGVNLKQFNFEPGDIITHIGSEDVRQGRFEITDVIQEFAPGQSTPVKILRKNKPETIEIKL